MAKYLQIGPKNGTFMLITFGPFNIFEWGLLHNLPSIKGFPKHINM